MVLQVHGHAPRFGLRLACLYSVSEVACIVSGRNAFFCDPSGTYLPSGATAGPSTDSALPALASRGASGNKAPTGNKPATAPSSAVAAGGVKGGDQTSGTGAGTGGGTGGVNGGVKAPIGRIYPLVPSDFARRFPDMFLPMALFGFDPLAGKPFDGTLIRLPLRTTAQALQSRLSSHFWSGMRLRTLFSDFRAQAQHALLSLECVEAISTSDWSPGESAPVRTLQVSLSMPQHDASQRGALLNDSSWRKTGLASLFGRPAVRKENVYVVDLLEVFRRGAPEERGSNGGSSSASPPVVGPIPVEEGVAGGGEVLAISAISVGEGLGISSTSSLSADSIRLSLDGDAHYSAANSTLPTGAQAPVSSAAKYVQTAPRATSSAAGASREGSNETDETEPSQPDESRFCFGEEEHHSSRWAVSEAVAVGPARALALEGHYAALGLVPFAAVAAQLLCDGKPPEKREGGFGAPLPLHDRSGLPVFVFGRFELSRPNRGLLLTTTSNHTSDQRAVAWNRSLFGCVVAAYASLLKRLPRMLGLPANPTAPGILYPPSCIMTPTALPCYIFWYPLTPLLYYDPYSNPPSCMQAPCTPTGPSPPPSRTRSCARCCWLPSTPPSRPRIYFWPCRAT